MLGQHEIMIIGGIAVFLLAVAVVVAVLVRHDRSTRISRSEFDGAVGPISGDREEAWRDFDRFQTEQAEARRAWEEEGDAS